MTYKQEGGWWLGSLFQRDGGRPKRKAGRHDQDVNNPLELPHIPQYQHPTSLTPSPWRAVRTLEPPRVKEYEQMESALEPPRVKEYVQKASAMDDEGYTNEHIYELDATPARTAQFLSPIFEESATGEGKGKRRSGIKLTRTHVHSAGHTVRLHQILD